MKKVRNITTLILILFLIACRKEDNAPVSQPAPQYLVSATLLETSTKDELQSALAGVPSLTPFVMNGIKIYKITFNTKDYQGNRLVASGAVYVPTLDTPVPLFCYQHGTIFPSDEPTAPSYNAGSGESILSTVMAANGFLTVAPDNIGYGVSKTAFRQTNHYFSSASSALDMLNAVKEMAAQWNIRVTDKLFLSGWSQGAGSAVALSKVIQDKGDTGFNLVASAPYAGAYHMSAFADTLLKPNTADVAPFATNAYAWIVKAYNAMYNINQPSAYYFGTYAPAIDADIETDLPVSPTEVFASQFRNDFRNRTGPGLAMYNAFKDNDVYDWRPNFKLSLYHGTADDYVPFFNSQDAFTAMKARGATDVILVPLPGANHSTGVLPFLVGMLTEWQPLK